jgi:hypothetical protein
MALQAPEAHGIGVLARGDADGATKFSLQLVRTQTNARRQRFQINGVFRMRFEVSANALDERASRFRRNC